MQQNRHTRNRRKGNSAGQSRSRASYSPFHPNIEGYGAVLQSMSADQYFYKPTSHVTLNLQAIEPMATATVEYLQSMNIETEATDVGTIATALKLQAYAKVARGGTNIVHCFSRGLKSMAAYIDHIGSFELDGQRVYPRLPEFPAAQPVPDGFIKTNVRIGKGTLYIDNREDPIDIEDVGALFRLPEARRQIVSTTAMNTIDFNNIRGEYQSYRELLQRVENRLSPSIVPIDLDSGKGTAAQIVGSRDISKNLKEVNSWCHRAVSPMTMVAGAGFQFGYQSTDAWHIEGPHVAQTAYVDTTAFFDRLMHINDIMG